VVLVTIDEKSLGELGRWPWPRVRLAQLLDALVKAEVKVVGFDIVWAEPDENSQLKVLREIRQKLAELKVANRTWIGMLPKRFRRLTPTEFWPNPWPGPNGRFSATSSIFLPPRARANKKARRKKCPP